MTVRLEGMRVFALAALGFPLVGAGNLAPQPPLFYEDFADSTLAANGSLNGATPNIAAAAGGVASLVDASSSSRASFTVVQEFSAPLMTF